MKSVNSSWSLVACANDRYAPGLEILIIAIANASRAGQEVIFHVIDCGLVAKTRERLLKRLTTYSNISLSFVDPPTDQFKFIQTHRYHISAYYRLGLPEIIPAHRVVYLDSDVLPLSTLDALIHKTDFCTTPVAAIRDFETHSLAEDSDAISQIYGGHPPGNYFNSGVMGMDLEALRKEDFTAKACDLLSRLGKHARFADQSAFNALLAGRWSEVDPTWNTPAWVFDQQSDNRLPGILHYTNSAPWLQRHYRPSQALFERVAQELGVTLPKPEKGLRRTIPSALAKWLLAPARVAWHGLRGILAARQGDPKKATGERHIMRHWWHYFTGGPARVLRYHRRIRQIRHPQFKVFTP